MNLGNLESGATLLFVLFNSKKNILVLIVHQIHNQASINMNPTLLKDSTFVLPTLTKISTAISTWLVETIE